MKTRTRFIKSVIATSRQEMPDLPFSRQTRKASRETRTEAPASKRMRRA